MTPSRVLDSRCRGVGLAAGGVLGLGAHEKRDLAGGVLVLAAHGTRDPAGVRAVEAIADGVRGRLPGVRVVVGFADVRGPSVAEVVAGVDGAVVVPAFLGNGYHVRVDLPAQVAGRAPVTPALGPAPGLIRAAADRLREAGWSGEPVILAAAGSSDPRSRAETAEVAESLSTRLNVPVRVAYATGTPNLSDPIPPGWAVASWLLAPGLFHHQALATKAPVVANPLGAHPEVVTLITTRYQSATPTHPQPSPHTASPTFPHGESHVPVR